MTLGSCAFFRKPHTQPLLPLVGTTRRPHSLRLYAAASAAQPAGRHVFAGVLVLKKTNRGFCVASACEPCAVGAAALALRSEPNTHPTPRQKLSLGRAGRRVGGGSMGGGCFYGRPRGGVGGNAP